MIRTLREREIFKKEVTPVLVMSDFSMAIINACLREFNNESLEEYFERGFWIVNGKATPEEVQKTIHHVCSAHMMQIIKRHAKNLCEKGHPAESQIHIAMRFFGRLLTATSLKEMKGIVSLGYVIFKTKFVCDMLTEKLDQFSECIRAFNSENIIDEELVESDNESNEEGVEFSENPVSNEVIGPCSSVKLFWEEELQTIKKTNTLKEVNSDRNKYYMPAFFDYVAKHYLPSCILWSNLLLGDLSRHNADYSSSANLAASAVRNYSTDNQTNGEIEDFFKIKKKCSFKGQRHLRLDTFIGENYNLALQRQFVDAMIKQNNNIRQSTKMKLQTLCSTIAKEPTDSPDASSDLSKNYHENEMELLDNNVSIPEEQWQKPSPGRPAHKKGRYLNSTSKKLNFNPSMTQKNERKVGDLGLTNFEEYERLVWPDVSSRIHGYDQIKKEI
jgi:hypothetical protein